MGTRLFPARRSPRPPVFWIKCPEVGKVERKSSLAARYLPKAPPVKARPNQSGGGPAPEIKLPPMPEVPPRPVEGGERSSI